MGIIDDHFGDDVDRPLQKDDKSWTYFASDIAYHNHKIKRNYRKKNQTG